MKDVTLEIYRRTNGAYRLSVRQWVDQPVDVAFAFFADAANLRKITPPWLHFHILTPLPIAMFAGQTIDYRLRLHGIPVRWHTKITEWDPPYGFVDEQERGPYHQWVHRHRFIEHDGGTRLEDDVDYRSPGGRLLHALFIKRDLTKIFAYRSRVIADHFANAESFSA
ncbi:MAG: CDP-paratose 2-epimerase [Planctomycetes bacterium]|nr:CDP-paratose 2-epimerase [Planctomycetota bacterium]